MAIPNVITDLSATIASNSPAGGDAAFPNIDDYLRAAYGFIRQNDTKASDVASAATVDLGAVVGRIVDVTGTTTITSFGTVAAGIWRIVRFTGALTLTHNATSLQLPGSASIVTGAGDCLIAVSLGSGNWKIPFYQRYSMPKFSASPSSAVTLAAGSTTIICDSEDFDTASAFNATTGVFTAPVAGFYEFNVSLYASVANTTEVTELRLLKNSTLVGRDIRTGDGPTARTFSISKLLSLSAGDTVSVVFSNGSLTAGTASVSNGQTYFTGHQVA